MDHEVLLIDCPDEKGLVHKITGVLYDHGLNIISNQEFVDSGTNYFFMRTAFEGHEEPERITGDLQETLPADANIRHATVGQQSLVLMATMEPHCLGDLLLRHSYGEIPARVEAVISNHETLRPLSEAFEIPFHHISHKVCTREEHEARILDVLSGYSPDYLVLAKYMRIFTPNFIDRFVARIINIHHSFLPAFTGSRPYKQAYRRGVKIIGATAHFVTEELDEGPIIAQNVIPVNHAYSAEEMAQAGRDVEKNVLAKALKLVLEERVFIHHNRTVVFE